MNTIQSFRLVCLVGALAAVVWWLRDTPPLRELAARLRTSAPAQWITQQGATIEREVRPPAANAAPGVAAAALRKCIDGAQVTYTNGDCPAGSRAQAVSGGTITVLPATPVPAPPPGAVASGSVMSELAGVKPGEPTLKDKYLDQVK
ncbi:hypothetical protein [Aquabacterium humicola]|uniref:hypothetical protein n=1 Tax=Aquabacterium humicola TaxID=3237377 RepID=UPI002542A808|nr:hypothetical protein [Rubrivivax pictus]